MVLVGCAHCSMELPQGAAFCGGCGARVAPDWSAGGPPAATARPGFAAAGQGTPVCPGCGVVAPPSRERCDLCSSPLRAPAVAVAPRPELGAFVQVRCERRCRSCGAWTPVNHLDLDDTFRCARCDLIQAFDAGVWQEALHHAHAVADLAGSELGGEELAAIGRTATTSSVEMSGMSTSGGVMRSRSLRLQAGPGHPLCRACRAPLEVTVHAADLHARCPGCGDEGTHITAPAARQLAPGLLGALADDHRSDRPDAREVVSDGGGAVALRCPSCSASLELDPHSHFVRCGYCNTTSRVPSNTLFRVFHQQAVADPFWLLFRGPSPRREELERDARRRALAVLGAKAKSAREAAADGPARGRRRTGEVQRGRRSPLDRLLAVGTPLAILVLVGLIGFPAELRGIVAALKDGVNTIAAAGQGGPATGDPAAGRAAGGSAGAPAGAVPEPPVPPARHEFATLGGCACSARIAGREGRRAPPERVQLAVRVAPPADTDAAAGERQGRALQFYVDIGEREAWLLELGAEDAPPRRMAGDALELGLACDGDVLVVAGGGHATGWSLSKRRRLWSAPVADRARPAGTRSSGDNMAISCRALTVRGGRVTVPTRGGKLRLRTRDGARR